MAEVKRFTIDRRKWARGGKNGDSQLLNYLGNRCCLGFYLKACGVPDENILNMGMPSEVYDQRLVPRWLRDVDEAGAIAVLNDDDGDEFELKEEEREEAVRAAFAAYGVQVKFTN